MAVSAEALVTEHLDALYGLARAWLRDEALAEDLTHRTFLKAFERRGQLRNPEAARAWLIGILRNEITSEFRTQARQVTWDPETLEALPASDPDPDLFGPALEVLPLALDRLPEATRAILLLRFQQELTYDEISRTLAIPLGTVMSRLHRAKLALKNQIEALTLPEGAT